MKRVLNAIRFEIKAILVWIEFKKKKQEAMLKHRLTGKQYFIIPTLDGHCVIINNESQKAINKIAGKLGVKKMNHHDLLKKAWFSTPNLPIKRS